VRHEEFVLEDRLFPIWKHYSFFFQFTEVADAKIIGASAIPGTRRPEARAITINLPFQQQVSGTCFEPSKINSHSPRKS